MQKACRGQIMSKAKYKQGRKIESVADFEKSKCTYFKVHGKSTHRAWIESWQYRVLKNFINAGVIYEAELIDKESETPFKKQSEK
jgi:hypothetical protein